MPVLASLWHANMTWISQPELHLHPEAQCNMGDVLIRAFNRDRFSVTETHSEHLLLRMLRRIRQTSNGTCPDPELKCLPENVSVLYFEPTVDGCTRVRPLRVTRQGDFMDRWPSGFFEERGRELFDE
jgi:predicted ATPase